MEKYDHLKIEKKWRQVWEKKLSFKAVDFDKKRKKFYALVEFPYPSGEGLHVGHARTYITLDIFARKKRMEGKNVLYPMGWDAFGLPTENYAIKTGIHPALATKKNTDHFRSQMKELGLAYNWDREINTTDPAYYKWTQWIFVKLFKKGLAYKKKMPINWCPSCRIGLANEEVVNGRCERCGTVVGRKELSQWLLRITAYADRLASGLDLVDFPQSVVLAQRNWIGKSEGAIIKFKVQGSKIKDKFIDVFTTRPDTLFGATFLVLAPEHKFIKAYLKGGSLLPPRFLRKVKKYIAQAKKKTELERSELSREKTGVFTGLYGINPANGQKIPIFISDFVLSSYGTGAVMGVPAHDGRDFQFAKKYGLPIKSVIDPDPNDPNFAAICLDVDKVRKKGGVLAAKRNLIKEGKICYAGEGRAINSGKYNGLVSSEFKKRIIGDLKKIGLGKKAVSYHLRDWIFSRQHYWGEPIPMIYCQRCGWVSVREEELPVKLPKVKRYQPTGTGQSPLAACKDWVKVSCPNCGALAKRETDTMPNWAGSSWYFLRFVDPKNNKALADKKKLEYWLPVDLYFGGAEHTTLHLLYSRFWHKFLNDIGVAPGKEPYLARRVHGVVLGEDGKRMSKSRGNVVTQDEVVKHFGADSLRVFSMFLGPYDGTFSWSTAGIRGTRKFLERFYRWVVGEIKKKNKRSERSVKILVNRLIKEVGQDIDSFKFNVAVARFMEFLNNVQGKKIGKEDLSKVLRALAPFAPFLTEELWQKLMTRFNLANWSIHQQPWPKYEEKLVREEEVVLVVEVNGKVRGEIKVQSSRFKVQSEVEKLARENPKVRKYLQGKKIRRVVFVPGRLINFVTD